MWWWSCCCSFRGQKKSEILHMAIRLAALMMNCCFPKNPWQSLCLSLAPHNPRAFQADPNAIPSQASNPNVICLTPPPADLLVGQFQPGCHGRKTPPKPWHPKMDGLHTSNPKKGGAPGMCSYCV